MSKEATGGNGALLGSSDYWDRLNRSTFFGDIMSLSSGTDYYRTLEEVGEKAQGAIEEIYQDLSDNGRFLHMLPSSDRESLAKQVLALYDVCRMTGLSAMRSDDCVNGLNLSCMSPWSNPFRDESAIQSAISLMKSNPYYSGNEALKLVREAADWGISFAAGSDERKRALLETLAQGKNHAFLLDVADEYENENGSKDYCGKCGYAIGSSGYLNAIESEVFGKSLPMTYGAAWGSPDYVGLLRDGIRMITEQLERDLDDVSRENYYITDETARKLKDAVSELSQCGVSTFSLESKIEKLAWFVGGDSAKILQLQRDLNDLGFGRLTEDGVYGKKTNNTVESFLQDLSHGTFSSLTWVDPLQRNITKIKTGTKITKSGQIYSQLMTEGVSAPIFKADKHTYHGIKDYTHVNVNVSDIPDIKERQIEFASKLDHKHVSNEVYAILKDFDHSAKVVKTAGKVLLVTGIVLDTLELYGAIENDLNDADRKLGRTTSSAVASIVGSWGLGAVGAEGGAVLSAAIGTAILPGVGTAIGGVAGGLVLGIVDSSFGGRLGNYIIDITELE